MLMNMKMINTSKSLVNNITPNRMFTKKIRKATHEYFMNMIWLVHWIHTLYFVCMDTIFKKRFTKFISIDLPIFDNHTHQVIRDKNILPNMTSIKYQHLFHWEISTHGQNNIIDSYKKDNINQF